MTTVEGSTTFTVDEQNGFLLPVLHFGVDGLFSTDLRKQRDQDASMHGKRERFVQLEVGEGNYARRQ